MYSDQPHTNRINQNIKLKIVIHNGGNSRESGEIWGKNLERILECESF